MNRDDENNNQQSGDGSEFIENDGNQEAQGQMEELQRCLANSQEWQNKFLRATADYENLTRRVQKERAQWANAAQENVLSSILTLVDDFDRALSQPKPEGTQVDSWLAGFTMIAQSLNKILKKFDVTEITDFSTFDPELHEAVMQVESADHEAGAIVQVLQKGYLFKGAVLRPAKVSVAQ